MPQQKPEVDKMKNSFSTAIAIMLLCAILAAHSVSAQVIITEALYDPSTSESDTEFVELYNTGDSAVDISGWSLNTTTQQALLPQGTIIKPGSYFLIADIDNSGVWPTDWPTPDYAEEITLPNSNSGVKLIDSSANTIDVVGWGNPVASLYLGTPHPHVKEGESIARKQLDSIFSQTSNNSNDFLAALPSPKNSHASDEPTQEIIIHASVQGNAPKIDRLMLTQDDSSANGIQIMPMPGKPKKIILQAIVSDEDGSADVVSVRARLTQKDFSLSSTVPINTTASTYTGNISLEFYDAPGNYTLSVYAEDTSGLNTSSSLSFEYLAVVAFELDTHDIRFESISGQSSEVIGDQDMATKASPTVRNIGNTKLDFSVSGTSLNSGVRVIPSQSLLYTFEDSDFASSLGGALSITPSLKAVNLAPGAESLREFSLRLNIPLSSAAGDYQGSIFLKGVVS
jgi:hypothetical protein